MKPVAIFRHYVTEGPGYFSEYLDRAVIPWTLIKLDQSDPVPGEPDDFSGLAFMGGPMSVNDPLPWIPPVLSLIQAAVARDVPVLGHCLGGQLMSKALGGVVTRALVKEIGWGPVKLEEKTTAKLWFGSLPDEFHAFHWHGETFSVPTGATRVLSSPWCENQAFALGKHLGLQCHIEMTESLVRSWCETGEREIRRSNSIAVQPVDKILASLEPQVQALHRVADAVYAHWTAGLRA